MSKILELADAYVEAATGHYMDEYVKARAALVTEVEKLEAENAKLRSFAQEYIEAWDEGMAGDSYLLRIARAALGETK